MFKAVVIAGAMAAFPAVAYADGSAPVAGAATGAVAGALVGGPIGAVVGGVSGAIVGGIATNNQPRFRHYVAEERRPSYRWDGTVAVGAELPADVSYWDVPPEYGVTNYRYTIVDNQPVLVDPSTHRIVQVFADNPDMGAAVPAGPDAVVMSDDQQTRFDHYVDQENLPSYRWSDRVAVGAELPAGVTFYDVPREYGAQSYRFTIVNGSRVLVDPRTRRIVRVMGEGDHDMHGDIRNDRPMTGDHDINGKMRTDRAMTTDHDVNGKMRTDRAMTTDHDMNGQMRKDHVMSSNHEMRSTDSKGVEGRAAAETRRRDHEKDENQK